MWHRLMVVGRVVARTRPGTCSPVRARWAPDVARTLPPCPQLSCRPGDTHPAAGSSRPAPLGFGHARHGASAAAP